MIRCCHDSCDMLYLLRSEKWRMSGKNIPDPINNPFLYQSPKSKISPQILPLVGLRYPVDRFFVSITPTKKAVEIFTPPLFVIVFVGTSSSSTSAVIGALTSRGVIYPEENSMNYIFLFLKFCSKALACFHGVQETRDWNFKLYCPHLKRAR